MKYFKICPQCGSVKTSERMIGQGVLKDYCKACNFEAFVFPEMTEEEAKKFSTRTRQEGRRKS